MTMFELVIPAFERHLLWSKFQEHVRLYLVRINEKQSRTECSIERGTMCAYSVTVYEYRCVRVISVYSILW